jgi:DNA-binding transcriptional LysR family regulator
MIASGSGKAEAWQLWSWLDGNVALAWGGGMMDIQLLRTFVVVAEVGSVTLAARRLGYTQPGLSQRIRTLERTVGCRLFVRRPSGMALTEEGLRMMPYARTTVLIVNEMLDALTLNDGTRPALGSSPRLPSRGS